MKLRCTISILFLCPTLFSFGQVSVSGVPESFSLKTKQTVILPEKHLNIIDTSFYVKEDIKYGIVNRYSVFQDIDIDIRESGVRTEILGKGYIWRYKLKSPGAYSMGLIFSDYQLPEGARLFIYSEDKNKFIGAFTHLNNKESGLLAISEFPGQSTVIEYFEPYTPEFKGRLVIGSVSQAYRDMSSFLDINFRVGINCPEGSDWQDEKHSVCRMTYKEGQYGYFCTGFLVNNVSGDGTPYFMTANHCISTSPVAATLITYFNYENSTCTSSDAATIQTLSGASLKSTATTSDFTLLLLNEVPPVNYNAYLAGWDASVTNPQKGIAIHHPEGTPKSISIDNDNPVSYPFKINWDNSLVSLENTHWSVKFETGNTESGSSGSPLFDINSRVIGQLHGGDDAESFYGKFSVSWDRNILPATQLKAWLDPKNTGIKVLDGTYLKAKPISAFSASYYQTCPNETITLLDESMNSPSSWQWEIEPAAFTYVGGTGSNSRNPQVVFNQPGDYSVRLITSNYYGTDTVLYTNFISVAGSIDINFLSIPPDTVYCGYNLSSMPVIVKGARSYSFEIDNPEKLGYIFKSDSLILNVAENAGKSGSFEAMVKVKGITGSCEDTDSITLNIILPPNDYIQNAIRLWPGNNQGFNNFCGSAEKNEPRPSLASCFAQDSWCPGALNYQVNNSIWFTFVGPSSGKVTIGVQSPDPRIAVYEAESYKDILSGNSALYSIIAANDNRAGIDLNSRIEDLKVDPGKTYWLQVDSKPGMAGDVSVSILSNSLEVFPNPSNGVFDIIVSSMDEGPAYLSIYSNLGKEILAKTLETTHDNNRFTVDLSAFPSGIYNLKVKTANYTVASKVMILTN